jgi:hypothetical protein
VSGFQIAINPSSPVTHDWEKVPALRKPYAIALLLCTAGHINAAESRVSDGHGAGHMSLSLADQVSAEEVVGILCVFVFSVAMLWPPGLALLLIVVSVRICIGSAVHTLLPAPAPAALAVQADAVEPMATEPDVDAAASFDV